MEFLEVYANFVFAVVGPFVGLGTWALCRHRLPDLPDADAFWARFCLVFYGLSSGFFLFLGLMQQLGGFDSFMYIFTSRDHFNIFVLAPRVAIFGLWVAVLWWIVLAGGAERLAPYPVLSGQPSSSPFLLKMYTVLIIVGLVVMLTFFNVTGILE